METHHIITRLTTLFFFFTIGVNFSVHATECTIRYVATISNIDAEPSGSPTKERHNGLSGAFIGAIGDRIIMAGGADFPAMKPWEGGRKIYYDDIYIISRNNGKYMCSLSGQKFPIKICGGCSASDGKTIYCFGGSDEASLNKNVYAIRMNTNKIDIIPVTTLPENFEPSSAAYHNGDIYVHGTDKTNNRLFRLSTSSLQWKELAGCPDRPIMEGAPLIYQYNGREEALYLIGGRGTDNSGLYLSSSIWEYLPTHNRWVRKAHMTSKGDTTSLMYSSAVQYGSSHILVFGGDNGIDFRKRHELENKIYETSSTHMKDSLNNELVALFRSHDSFSNKIFAYHTITGTWTEIGISEHPLPVATSAVRISDSIIIPSGETHPGVRTGKILEAKISDPVSFGWINYTVIIIYLLGMMGIGLYFSRKAKSTDQFFKGGSKIPWWAAGISIFATALSAITFLSIPAKAYMADWGMFMFNMAILLIVPIVIHFYLPFFRKLNVASAYQYLEDRFSSPVRYLASAFFCLFMFARVAIVLFLPSLALNAVTGLNVYVCILLMGLVTIAYCTMGGIEAVVWGDVIQGIILVGGAIISLIYLISGVDGGLPTVINTAIEDKKFNILDLSLDWTRPVFWVTFIGGIANQLLTYTSDQSVIQRYITVKDIEGTKKGLWLNGILSVPIAIIFFSIGTGLYVFFKQQPELLNVGMNNTDSIFPHFIMCDLPTGVAGLLIAAIFAAAMSTLSANINSTSTVMTEDFYSKIFKKTTDRNKMRFARWTGIILGIFGISMAILLATFDIASLWDQFNFFLGLLTSGLGGLFMMGIFTKRIGTKSALTGFAGSIVVLLLFNSYSHVSVILYGFIGLVSCFMIGYLSSFIFGYRK